MRITYLFIIFLLLIIPSFAENVFEDDFLLDENSNETLQEESIIKTEGNNSSIKNHYFRSKLQLSPKKEHEKVLLKANKSIEKDKIKFQIQKENQLWLLNNEYKSLEYTP